MRLRSKFDWKLVPAYNVIATLRGAELPDQWIVRGNHHDAWVNGASDPVSGMVALMEEARAIAELVKSGFKPQRTLVFAGWDAEEPGLLGSTEWVEDKAAELSARVVAYVNSDSNGARFPRRRRLSQPRAARERDRAGRAGSADEDERGRACARAHDPQRHGRRSQGGARPARPSPIAALGSGSDYTPFLQHLGIASLNLGFGGEGDYGQYHSIYDSFDHYTRFMDPDFAYGVALAKVAGRAVLRLSEADMLPFEFSTHVGACAAATSTI